ncbi:glycosyltransferase family 52 [Parabacteroides sp.]|uniref:glycosyltransferase family 52 n=1 Tax=Parabacteroides sp. TaxID=1869337 RepID=UPI003080C813
MILLKKYKAIVYLPNLYAILQFLLLNENKWEDILFLTHPGIDKKVSERISDSYCLYTGRIDKYITLIKLFILSVWNRGTSVYLGADLFYTNSFLRFFHKNIIYLEDGVASYQCIYKKEKQILKKRSSFFMNLIWGPLYPWFGLAEQVSTIYLTAIFPVPDLIKKKVKVISLKDLWVRKTIEKQQEIMYIFLLDNVNLNLFSQYDTLLITQPFSEISNEKEITEIEKIEIYRRLISNYDEATIIIKPHPSEKTDYQKYFSKAYIFNEPCPLELLVLLNCQIKRAITIYSTAIFNMGKDVEKIITGYSISPKLAKQAEVWGWSVINDKENYK